MEFTYRFQRAVAPLEPVGGVPPHPQEWGEGALFEARPVWPEGALARRRACYLLEAVFFTDCADSFEASFSWPASC